MTPKEYATYILRDVSHKADITELAQAYLALESRIQKLEAVAEAGQKLLHYLPNMEVLGAARYSAHLKTVMQFREALAELEKK